MRSNGSLSEVQVAIGRCLRAEYALERSMPTQIANLLKHSSNETKPEATTRRLC